MVGTFKQKREEGFTIIEVLIVLAIAGLIMLIVFLAVPALQRNARNTQRTADASRIASAVNECMNNNNGTVASCNNLTGASLSTYITMAQNQQLVAVGAGIGGATLTFSQKCNPAGTAGVAGGGSKSFVVTYEVEVNGTATAPRCLGS